jgi:hypothetical protein
MLKAEGGDDRRADAAARDERVHHEDGGELLIGETGSVHSPLYRQLAGYLKRGAAVPTMGA